MAARGCGRAGGGVAGVRVVSLCPSLTELVFDLGRGDWLVGRTKFCVHPAGQVAAVEVVGGTKNPKVARILELAPDLVLLNEEENRREDADALRAADVACHVSFPKNAEDTAAMVRSIGAALDADAAAERIAGGIEARAAAVRADVASLPPVRYACLVWRRPYMGVSDDTYIAGLLALAGGRNVFGTAAARYPEVGDGEIASASPDVVLLTTEPFPFAPKHVEELAAETGIARERFRIVDGERLSWHGSRTAAGIDYAARVLRD